VYDFPIEWAFQLSTVNELLICSSKELRAESPIQGDLAEESAFLISVKSEV